MPIYYYRARDKFSILKKGKMEGDSQESVAAKLHQAGYIPISVTPLAQEIKIENMFDRVKRVRFSDLNMFTRQFYTLQKAGLPLISSFNALREQAYNRTLKDVVGLIIRDIEGGASLSAALEKHPAVFNKLYVSMVRSGEASGTLDEVLERLASLGEHEEKIRMQIKAAARYPIMVVAAIAIAFLVLTTAIVPRFEKLYGEFKTALPLPTQILIGINHAITNFWWLSIILVACVIFLWYKFINTQKGRFWWDALKIKVPIVGPLMLKLSMSRFSRIMGTLMRSGVPILQVLDLASEGVGNVAIARVVSNIKASVNEGSGMLEPVRISGIFPPVVVQMISVGEETGNLDELLMHVSEYYDAQIDYTFDNFVSLIEPILIVVLGCGVLFMALAIFLPIWSLMRLFRG